MQRGKKIKLDVSHCNRQPENRLCDPHWQLCASILRSEVSLVISRAMVSVFLLIFTHPQGVDVSEGLGAKEGLLVSPRGVMGPNAYTGT